MSVSIEQHALDRASNKIYLNPIDFCWQ